MRYRKTGCYRLAGQRVLFGEPMEELAPFWVAEQVAPAIARDIPPPQARLYRGPGWIGGKWRTVESWSAAPGYLLRVEDGGDIEIMPNARAILIQQGTQSLRQGKGKHRSCSSRNAVGREAMLGPALVLGLAMRGIWCLHASALVLAGKVTAFLGESGSGKSTLAAGLAAQGFPTWQRAADDILPVALRRRRIEARLRFPQLKLPVEEQPSLNLPESLPLMQILVLAKADRRARVEFQPLSPRQAAQFLVRHTAGARLFGAELLRAHLDFCARLAQQVPAFRLVYPHRLDGMEAVKEFLERQGHDGKGATSDHPEHVGTTIG